MSLKQFLKSGAFFKSLLLAGIIVVVCVFGLLQFLGSITHHGEEIPVPNLKKLTLEKATERLEELDLELLQLDTLDFDPSFPPYSIVEQDPLPAVTVKAGRKIYVKINAGAYEKITLPALINNSYRQVSSTLRALGLQEGTVTYVPYMGKDVVLEMKYKGKQLTEGSKVSRASVIDLVLGDGKTGFTEEEETLNNEQLLTPAPLEEELEITDGE